MSTFRSAVSLITALFFCLLSPPGVHARVQLPDSASGLTECVVAVTAYGVDGEVLQRGRGFFTGTNGDIVTSFHLLRRASSLGVLTSWGETLKVSSVTGLSHEHDLARITITHKVKDVPCPPPAIATAVKGEKAFLLRNGFGTRKSFIAANVSATLDIPVVGKVLELSRSFDPLYTGSPAVNSSGRLIGIAVSYAGKGGRKRYLMPAGALMELEGNTVESLPLSENGGFSVELAAGRESFMEGLRLILAKRYGSAASHFEKAALNGYRAGGSWFLAGFCAKTADSHHDAARALKSALRADPGNTAYLRLLAEAYVGLRCFQDAAETYEKVVAVDRDDMEAWYRLAYSYSRLDWQKEATSTFKEVIAARCRTLSPGDAACSGEAMRGLTGIFSDFEKFSGSDNAVADRHYQRGLTYLVLAKMDLALREYRSLRKFDRIRAAALYKLIRN